jgi:hypothetical protein
MILPVGRPVKLSTCGEDSATSDCVRPSPPGGVVATFQLDEPLGRQARDTAGDELSDDHGAAEDAQFVLSDLDLCPVERSLGCFGDADTPPLTRCERMREGNLRLTQPALVATS